jgi:hypothetical protein
LEQVRLASIELIDGLEEITVAPADFVSLDPDLDGLVMDRGAALAVRRGGSTPAHDRTEPYVTETLVPELVAVARSSQTVAASPSRPFDDAAYEDA